MSMEASNTRFKILFSILFAYFTFYCGVWIATLRFILVNDRENDIEWVLMSCASILYFFIFGKMFYTYVVKS